MQLSVSFGVMVITVNMQELIWREKTWAGIEGCFKFLPKPSLDRARTAQNAGESLLTGNWERARGHGFKSRPARHQRIDVYVRPV